VSVSGELTHDGTSRTAKAGDLELHYHEAGPGFETSLRSSSTTETEVGGGLPLVMLHGGGPGASAWSNFGVCLGLFAQDFRTLLVDQPGFGRSDKPQIEGHFFTYAADKLAAFLDELGIEKVHLLGNSLGGGTAGRFVLKYPERVGRLVLMGPGGLQLNLFSPDPTEGIKRLYEFGGDPTPERMRAFVSTMVHNQKLVTDELVAERFANATAPGVRESMASMGASFFDPETAEDGMIWRDAHKIRHHTLITWGREDRVNPIDGAFLALKQMPKAQLHVFPNCGHWAQIEAAEAFHAVAKTFLAQHSERARKEGKQ
jgi:4,5:9,10-diseco-3-hydroxy-5,9,17-trioxoandrosta-1(10),2-diene-4-oate hydrolase